MRRLLILVGIALVVAGCAAEPRTASANGSPRVQAAPATTNNPAF
jgi:hypothetical protein